MKTVIGGKRYDTETATEVASYWNGYSQSDFNFVSEKLYKTRRGNWFLAGKGGAFSPYAESYGNSRCGSSSIRPLSPSVARAWLEERDKTEALEQHFGSELEDA